MAASQAPTAHPILTKGGRLRIYAGECALALATNLAKSDFQPFLQHSAPMRIQT
jgi:hypothetical protein